MNQEEAMEILYGEGIRYVTPEGYPRAISQERKKDRRRAQRVERALNPVLKEAFYRRHKEWYETSQGMRARLYLLPDNPHLAKDVAEIRDVLGIPPDQVRASEAHSPGQKLVRVLGPESISRVVEQALAGKWWRIHRSSALGQPIDPDPVQLGADYVRPKEELLEAEARESAEKSGRLDLRNATMGLTGKEIPQWLRRPPPPGVPQIDSPIEWAVARLVERYRLPWRIWEYLQLYILTLDKYWLGQLEFASTLLATVDPGPLPYQGFPITIWGVDEFITKKDLDQIWKKCVRPRQEELLEQRGMKPQGRRTVDLKRLKRGLPLYRATMEQGLPLEEALSELTRRGELGEESMDQSSARDLLQDLKAVLAPREEN